MWYLVEGEQTNQTVYDYSRLILKASLRYDLSVWMNAVWTPNTFKWKTGQDVEYQDLAIDTLRLNTNGTRCLVIHIGHPGFDFTLNSPDVLHNYICQRSANSGSNCCGEMLTICFMLVLVLTRCSVDGV